MRKIAVTNTGGTTIIETILNRRWALLAALAALAIPLGLLLRHNGFAYGGSLTLNLILTPLIFVALTRLGRSLLFWRIVWGIAALIWTLDIASYLFQRL